MRQSATPGRRPESEVRLLLRRLAGEEEGVRSSTQAVLSIVTPLAQAGRSATAAHLAAKLACRGQATLLIDADPQAAATSYFLDPEQPRLSIADALLGTAAKAAVGAGATTPGALSDVHVGTDLECLRLVPGDLRFALFERECPLALFRLRAEIAALNPCPDFVICDTPAALGQITLACLLASTHALVPAAPSAQPENGVALAQRLIEQARTANPGLQLLGVFASRVEMGDPAARAFLAGLRRQWGEEVCESAIYHDKEIAVSQRERQVAQERSPHGRAAGMYAELVDELLPELFG